MAVEDNSPSLSSDIATLNEVDQETSVKTQEVANPEPEVVEEPEEVTEEVTEEIAEETPKETPEESKEEFLPHDRPSVKEINAKYPNLFKDFPSLRHAFFREREFSQLFPSVEDAKVASENNQIFSSLQQDILSGTGESFVKSLKDSDSLEKFARNFLPNLYKTDREVLWDAVQAPLLQDVVRSFYEQGKRTGNEDLINSAGHLSVYLFGDPGVATGEKTAVKNFKESRTDPEVSKEREKFEQERFKAFGNSVQEDVRKQIVPLIEVGLPKETTVAIKNYLVERIISEVGSTIAQDKAHMKYVDSLWEKAKSAGYGSDSRSSIVSAFLARAKSVLPSVRRRLIAEILGSSVTVNKSEEVQKTALRKEPTGQGKPSGPQRVPSAKQVDWGKTSDLDFLNDNVALKK